MPVTSPDSIFYPDVKYSGSIRAALSTLATSIQAALTARQKPKHAEFTYSRASVANGTLSGVNAAPTVATGRGSADAADYFAPATTGITAIKDGSYTFTITMSPGTSATGRSFVAVTAGGAEYRATTTTDDLITVTATVWLAAGETAVVTFLQTTGATRTVSGRINVRFDGNS